jgi:hypothetical protein
MSMYLLSFENVGMFEVHHKVNLLRIERADYMLNEASINIFKVVFIIQRFQDISLSIE